MGRARIVDVIMPGMRLGAPSTHEASPNDSPWYTGGFAFVLANVEPLPFVRYKGSLGFFDVSDELLRLHGARGC